MEVSDSASKAIWKFKEDPLRAITAGMPSGGCNATSDGRSLFRMVRVVSEMAYILDGNKIEWQGGRS